MSVFFGRFIKPRPLITKASPAEVAHISPTAPWAWSSDGRFLPDRAGNEAQRSDGGRGVLEEVELEDVGVVQGGTLQIGLSQRSDSSVPEGHSPPIEGFLAAASPTTPMFSSPPPSICTATITTHRVPLSIPTLRVPSPQSRATNSPLESPIPFYSLSEATSRDHRRRRFASWGHRPQETVPAWIHIASSSSASLEESAFARSVMVEVEYRGRDPVEREERRLLRIGCLDLASDTCDLNTPASGITQSSSGIADETVLSPQPNRLRPQSLPIFPTRTPLHPSSTPSPPSPALNDTSTGERPGGDGFSLGLNSTQRASAQVNDFSDVVQATLPAAPETSTWLRAGARPHPRTLVPAPTSEAGKLHSEVLVVAGRSRGAGTLVGDALRSALSKRRRRCSRGREMDLEGGWSVMGRRKGWGGTSGSVNVNEMSVPSWTDDGMASVADLSIAGVVNNGTDALVVASSTVESPPSRNILSVSHRLMRRRGTESEVVPPIIRIAGGWGAVASVAAVNVDLPPPRTPSPRP
ncbi:hypothetical protein HDU67_007465 [Dinochytrium kinnereticum]|nr:hypothetical protein HDU67_007465 [Dinochytrium kinnereticum]